MSRKFVFGAIGMVAAGAAAAWLLHWIGNSRNTAFLPPEDLYAARLKMGEKPPPEQSKPEALPWGKTVRLAIGGLGFPDDTRNRRVGDLIAVQLSHSPGLELVERQKLDAVLREQELSLSGLVRASDAIRAGKLLRAGWFLLGTSAQVHGTNCLVARLVDASTGIMRDGAVFIEKSAPALALEVAGFVRQARRAAAETRPRVYLAIGEFEDLSVNNRQAEFPRQLRGYLAAAYHHSRFTLLEREYADMLLGEMELDLAGLTEGGGANAPVPLQSAFWLVDGSYQSYETTNLQVELELEVHRIFGVRTTVSLSGPPGEAICRQAKEAIDRVLNRPTRFVIPSRVSEARAQMAKGRELMRLSARFQTEIWVHPQYAASAREWDRQRAARSKRNLEEAVRAFKTVLLLTPGDGEAKLCLAACLRMPAIDRVAEARNYYRQIIEEPIPDRWTTIAQEALAASFENADPREAAAWLDSAAGLTTNTLAAKFYRGQAEIANEDQAVARGNSPKSHQLAEQRLFESIRSLDNVLHQKPGVYSSDMGMEAFVKTFGTNRAAAVSRLAALMPALTNEFPQLQPYLLATLVSFQANTNSPVIAEFQTLLGRISEHPDQILAPRQFWGHTRSTVVNWAFKHKRYGLAAEVLEARIKAKGRYHYFPKTDEDDDRISLAFACMGTKNWERALNLFEGFSNMPVQPFGRGPWGPGLTIIFTDKEAAYCRKKLGRPPVIDDREFEMGEPCLCLHTPAAFTVDAGGLWVAIGGRLIHLDFNLKTNRIVQLPISVATPADSLCVTTSNVWIGTDGEGLIEYNKANHQCRRLTKTNGLLMDKIASLQLSGDTLWIGYGRKTPYDSAQSDGGLGRLDLASGHLVSFAPSLKSFQTIGLGLRESSSLPTRQSVVAIAGGAFGDTWFITGDSTLHRYQTRDGTWKSVQEDCSSIVAQSGRLVLGQSSYRHGANRNGPLGVSILDLKNGQRRDLNGASGIPGATVTALALDGDDLWVGGLGYIALVHLPDGKMQRFARVRAKTVDQLEIGGGYVWAKYDWHLYRAPLAHN